MHQTVRHVVAGLPHRRRVGVLLEDRAAALGDGDRAAFLATVDTEDPAS